MDTTTLTDEIKQVNNPGFTDFGSGSVIVFASHCVRCKKVPTPCSICADFCPVGAIEIEQDGKPRITAACIKCAACVGVCPTNAIGSSFRNIQQFKKETLKASLRVNHLAIACERTAALLRLESNTDAPEAALKSLELIEESKGSGNLQVVPCIAMIPREMWFSVLSEIGTLKFEELSIFLPTGQCTECPVNAKDNIESLFGEAIGAAEQWSGHSVGIITEAEDLPQLRKANVRAYLTAESEMDRRGAFTGFVGELKKSWDENSEIDNQSSNEIQIQRGWKESFARTRLSADIKKSRPANKTPFATATRYTLIETVGRHEDKAEAVRVLVSSTDEKLCNLCGTCVNACPLMVRYFDEPEKEEKEEKRTLLKRARAVFEDALPNVNLHKRTILDDYDKDVALLYNMPTLNKDVPQSDVQEEARQNTQEEAQQDNPKTLVINTIYCVACSACIQVCPNEACCFSEIDGFEFLINETGDVSEVQI